ncbi:MAG: sugar transferase [Nanoarchaeota archaeon]|nr:sugar transferase [Nanoarchaeota archaeon]
MFQNLIYVKQCLGKDKEIVNIYKLRTMDLDADQRLDEITEGFDSYGHPIIDPRVTQLGRLLRRSWIDEIPQFYNLARGDIKLVGVRPSTEKEWRRYPTELIEGVFKQKPGLMGVQYAYPRTTNFNEHLEHMMEYIERWEKDPLITDKNYLFRILQNILFKGVRSS